MSGNKSPTALDLLAQIQWSRGPYSDCFWCGCHWYNKDHKTDCPLAKLLADDGRKILWRR